MKLPALLAASLVLGACSQTVTQQSSTEKTTMSAADAIDIAAADATCSHGAVDAERSFILCEDGALRRSRVEMALAQPVDPTLNISEIAKRYDRVTQNLVGIESATYGSITPKNRQPIVRATQIETSAADRETVQIGSTLFDVYRLEKNRTSGTIFVERATAVQE